MSKSKRDIIKSAIDTIVKNNGNYIDVILEKLISVGPYTSKDPKFKIGNRWQIPSSTTYSFIFLQLSKSELETLKNTNRGNTDRLYHDQNGDFILYNSKKYDDKFVLNSDWGVDLGPLIGLIDSIDSIILSEDDKAVLINEKKKSNTSNANKASSSDEGKSFGDTDTEEIDVEHRAEGEEEHHPLNLILYGPPGTGKTYNTVNEALDIIQPTWKSDFENQQNSPKGIKDERDYALYLFNQYKEEGRIVFTTFHQSLSYEEFIEGIKPIPGKNDVVATHNNATNPTPGATQFGEGTTTFENLKIMQYKPQDGIFKELCDKALNNPTEVVTSSVIKKTPVVPSTLTIGQLLDEFTKEVIAKGTIVITIDGHQWKITRSDKSFKVQKNNNRELSVTNKTIERDWNNFKNGKIKSANDIKPTQASHSGTHGASEHHWAVYNALRNFENELLQKEQNIVAQDVETTETITENVPQNYVLIIDEINRGNVSQIFGELITLIEEDKRLGNKEALTVKLPYSGEDFGVPGNLYIIGTMNTADHSVEALDTALRRRFDFKEMMPKPELVKGKICGYYLKDILTTINERIRVLKDREHQIGHSYFMKCKTKEDLKNVFKNNIVPLLQEYFYGNYAYIGLVLGDGFVKKEDAKPKFASLDGYTYDSDNEPTYRLLTDDEWEKLTMNNALDNLKVNKSDTSENVAENEQLS